MQQWTDLLLDLNFIIAMKWKLRHCVNPHDPLSLYTVQCDVSLCVIE